MASYKQRNIIFKVFSVQYQVRGRGLFYCAQSESNKWTLRNESLGNFFICNNAESLLSVDFEFACDARGI